VESSNSRSSFKMCGRTACTLTAGNIKRACAYRNANGEQSEPDWRDAPCGNTFKPSSNVPPTAYTPIMFKSKSDEARILQPMMWGIVPPWFKGANPKSHGLSTNNARLENVKDSKLYSGCLTKRCVVVCDGFYEWKRDNDVKQPYLIYACQDGHKIEEVLDYSQDPDADINQGEWNGPKLLKMAGLYSVWRGEDGVPVYSYTVLTRESNSVMSWLHHRMPCFLSEEQLEEWMDPSVSVSQAFSMLKPTVEGLLSWHTVSTSVGNVKNQELSLLQQVEPGRASKNTKVASRASASLMSNWLKRAAPDETKFDHNIKKQHR